MIINLSCAANDERLYIFGSSHPAVEMACDILIDVMEHDGDGTVEIYGGNAAPKGEPATTMQPRDALDRILTWVLDNEEDRTGLTAILDRLENVPPNWGWWRKFLAGGVIHLRDGEHVDG